jgi:hypothetical protein
MPGRDATAGASQWSRRSVLLSGAGFGAALLLVKWSDIAAAASASQTAEGTAFLSAAEAADVDAIASQIVPTDATPGAHEAGVLNFIDRALATFFAPMADKFRAELAEFQRACRERYPESGSFAALTREQQIEWLHAIDRTPFFEAMRLLTALGMFTKPEYGGNRDGRGWQLIGFADEHVFAPPFGYYDRDYPGFSPAERKQP